MQKEKPEILNEPLKEELSATPKNQISSGGSMEEVFSKANSGDDSGCAADSNDEFEKLIKGPYKQAFDKRVQGIINRRFKEIKTAEKSAEEKKKILLEPEALKENDENKSIKSKAQEQIKENPNAVNRESTVTNQEDDNSLSLKAAEIVAMGYKSFDLEREMENPIFKALLEGGVDMLTAYQALHINEIMDTSVKFGAENAAKQMADSIRFKVARPSENGLSGKGGFGTRTPVSGLNPKQRKELAKKALMGEEVRF